MPVKAQKLILRMYTLSELGKIWKQYGPWNLKTHKYIGCCNARDKNMEMWCTLAPKHNGPHIAHGGKDAGSDYVVGAWLNTSKDK